jgi:uncharacterized membrane protein
MIILHAIQVAAAGRLAAALPPGWAPIVPLVLLSVLIVLLLIKLYRERQDILDVEDPDSPEDLLRSFELAHRAGELDDDEFERVKQQLTSASAGTFRPNPEAVEVAELVRRRIAEADNDPDSADQLPADGLADPPGTSASDDAQPQERREPAPPTTSRP